MLATKKPLKVFLCHASTDKPKVRELYRYLKKRGIQPWFDEEHLVGGQDWQVEIPKALATSDAIIICLTKNSVDKEGYIQKEIKFALDKALEMPEGRIFLIPIKFEDCEVPFTLSRYQWVDLTVESGYGKMMKALKFRASQLERSTVEISKKDVEEENLSREKKERETAEQAERERKEKELSDKQAREAREKAKRETEKKEEKPATVKPKAGGHIAYWVGGFVVLVLGIIFLSSLNNPLSTPQPTPENTQTQETATLLQSTIAPSETTTPKATSTAVSTLIPTSLPNEITDAKGVSKVLVPAGKFTMGSDVSAFSWQDDMMPAHIVDLNSFYIDKYEVTNRLYKDCEKSGICTEPYMSSSFTRGVYHYNPDFDNYPVIYISWSQANTYCAWRGERLPTEAEWEKAARGTDGRDYPWGNDFDCSKANFNSCTEDTSEVGSYPDGVSPYGAYDMLGNVLEWVADRYSSTYYEISPLINPLGPTRGEGRVLRGGQWDSPVLAKVYFRDFHYTYRYTGLGSEYGFRCAMDATP